MTRNEQYQVAILRAALAKAMKELHNCALERPIDDNERIRAINAIANECRLALR